MTLEDWSKHPKEFRQEVCRQFPLEKFYDLKGREGGGKK